MLFSLSAELFHTWTPGNWSNCLDGDNSYNPVPGYCLHHQLLLIITTSSILTEHFLSLYWHDLEIFPRESPRLQVELKA